METCSCDIYFRQTGQCVRGRGSVGWVDKDDYASVYVKYDGWDMMKMIVDVSQMRMCRMLHHLSPFIPPLKTELQQLGQYFPSKTTLLTFKGHTNDRQLYCNQTSVLRGLKGCRLRVMVISCIFSVVTVAYANKRCVVVECLFCSFFVCLLNLRGIV